MDACIATANLDNYRGIGLYKELGYIPYNVTDHYNAENWSLSKTLEYAFDDYCIAEMAKKYPDCTFIGAHMGGMANWERVLYYIKDARNIYFDTAYCAEYMSDEMFMEMFRAYGEDRILFGSDLPWSDPHDEIRMIDRMPISDSAKEKIFYKNAVELLKIDI